MPVNIGLVLSYLLLSSAPRLLAPPPAAVPVKWGRKRAAPRSNGVSAPPLSNGVSTPLSLVPVQMGFPLLPVQVGFPLVPVQMGSCVYWPPRHLEFEVSGVHLVGWPSSNRATCGLHDVTAGPLFSGFLMSPVWICTLDG